MNPLFQLISLLFPLMSLLFHLMGLRVLSLTRRRMVNIFWQGSCFEMRFRHIFNCLTLPSYPLCTSQPPKKIIQNGDSSKRDCGGSSWHSEVFGDWSGLLGLLASLIVFVLNNCCDSKRSGSSNDLDRRAQCYTLWTVQWRQDSRHQIQIRVSILFED